MQPIRTALVLTLVSTPCTAAGLDPASVIVPWGDTVAVAAQTVTGLLLPLAVTAVTAALARLAGPLRTLVTATLVERLVRNVGDYAVNAVAGAVRGRTLSVPVGSAVIARVARLKSLVLFAKVESQNIHNYVSQRWAQPNPTHFRVPLFSFLCLCGMGNAYYNFLHPTKPIRPERSRATILNNIPIINLGKITKATYCATHKSISCGIRIDV